MFYKRSDQVKVKKVGNKTALYSSEQSGIHVLDDTSLFIWEVLREPVTFDELLYMLSEVFEGDQAEMKDDLQKLLDLFLQYKLVCTET